MRVKVRSAKVLREGFIAWGQYWRLVDSKRVKGVTLYVIARLDRVTKCKTRAQVLAAAWRPSK
jgi:hypothetical protein